MKMRLSSKATSEPSLIKPISIPFKTGSIIYCLHQAENGLVTHLLPPQQPIWLNQQLAPLRPWAASGGKGQGETIKGQA